MSRPESGAAGLDPTVEAGGRAWGDEVLASGRLAAEIAEVLFGDSYQSASRYVDILAARGMEWGLLGPREQGRLWERHVLNSAAVADLVPRGSRVLDVGSGAGLPGIPLALLRPDLEVVLLEPLQRRAEFLELALDELEHDAPGLGARVQIVRGRAEELKGKFDVVTGRAVAPLTKWLALTQHLFVPEGRLVVLKGESASQEVAKAGKELKKLRLVAEVHQVRAHPAVEATSAVVVRRD